MFNKINIPKSKLLFELNKKLNFIFKNIIIIKFIKNFLFIDFARFYNTINN
jgi:hypothetical protein